MKTTTASGTVLIGTVGLALLAGLAWFALLGPAFGSIGETEADRVEAQDQHLSLDLQLQGLRRQAEELPTLARTADRLQRHFPPTADQPGFFEQVTEAAVAAGISPDDVTALSPGVPVVVGPPPGTPPETVPADGTTEATEAAPEQATEQATDAAAAAGDAGAARAGEATGDPASAAPPVDPAAVAIQAVTIDVVGNHIQLVDLLDSLENMDRSLLLATASVTRSEEGLTLSLAGATFVAPPLGEPPAVR